MKKLSVLMYLLILPLGGCDLIDKLLNRGEDITNEVVSVLDRGIGQLGATSADWQDILNKVIDDLPEQVQSTITNEVSNLMNRGIAAAGAEFRCNVDFLRTRMRQGLQRIKSRFLGSELPPIEPHLCDVVPLAIDMSLAPNRRNKIELYGYDFDSANVRVIHEVGNSQIDVTNSLDRPTHYHMTLNLGASGVVLNQNSKRLILRWNNRDISSIAVIQPLPDICETKFANPLPSNITVMPVHATKPGKSRGDKEFDGNGPRMTCNVWLYNRGTSVQARIYVVASETKSDWSYAKADKYFTLYSADPGYTIESIVTPTFASYSYTDTDHASDKFAGSGPVQFFTFNGDGSGDDIGRHTKVTVQFNRMRIQLKETGDCVSSAMIRSLQLSGEISPGLMEKAESLSSEMKFIAPQELAPVSADSVSN